MTDSFVRTEDIKAAVEGHESAVLDAIGISGWRAGKHIICPYPSHADKHPSWRWDAGERRAFCTCDAHAADIFEVVARMKAIDFPAAKLYVAEILGRDDLIKTSSEGCSLAALADSKRLPVGWLTSLGVRGIVGKFGKPAVEIPYYNIDRALLTTRTRIKLTGKNHTLSAKGSRAALYGLDRLNEARTAGYVVLVEGETCCWTLWRNEFPTLGLPGGGVFNDERDAPHFKDIPEIYAVIEPDVIGEKLAQKLARSSLVDRVRLTRLRVKDASALWLDVGADPEQFRAEFEAALDSAEPCPEPREDDNPNLNKPSEDDLARKFTTAHGEVLRFVAKWGQWLLWTGGRWKFEETYLAFDLARFVARREASALMDRSLAKANVVAAIERLARADRQHAASAEQWDGDLWMFNRPEKEEQK